ncbi:Bug family tripartite tricarboxylate transporter substrate binding protein [Variovorax ginsengisoli]|uniref:Tripartite tricarboxylate transporter substrate binding protein n=1 Tax=Variovorax ginsengisoli TaxID=363844 RepID=A0ABT8SH18_9BURK|nr:tripartite tricarboxylate transporter substrate binding protein [Variovorax ginsengisoli]MDN8618342.1 tripartite tricarboxylate transporter substrate binding protein [Variovorax ginsengisoli]MDO1537512.1 tripartite tricarboxylate transporter substrate binding protein [Variovorax ginsengisoli]
MDRPVIARRSFMAAAAVAALGLGASGAWAQGSSGASNSYPNQIIRLVVPYPAGGATDILARMMAQKLQEAWGQTVIVDNRPGASGTIGNDAVAKAAPDGYTVLLGITAIVQVPALMPKLSYDVLKDLQPLALVASTNSVLVVPKSTPVKNLQEFIAMVKASPGQYNYGSYGVGTSSHIQGSLLNLQAGLDLVHVPYKGAAPLLQDMRGSQLTAALIDMATVRPQLDTLKPLAVTGTQRNKLLPDVPTFAELKFHSFEPVGWFGLFMPAGVPVPIAKKFADESNRILHLPDVVEKIEGLGMAPGGIPTDKFARMVRDDAAVYAKIIKDTKIRLD